MKRLVWPKRDDPQRDARPETTHRRGAGPTSRRRAWARGKLNQKVKRGARLNLLLVKKIKLQLSNDTNVAMDKFSINQ